MGYQQGALLKVSIRQNLHNMLVVKGDETVKLGLVSVKPRTVTIWKNAENMCGLRVGAFGLEIRYGLEGEKNSIMPEPVSRRRVPAGLVGFFVVPCRLHGARFSGQPWAAERLNPKQDMPPFFISSIGHDFRQSLGSLWLRPLIPGRP